MRQCLNCTIICLLAIVWATACSAGPTPGPEIRIVASIYPLAYFAGHVGGEHVSVHVLVEPGIDAHTFTPTVEDLRVISEADVLILNGLGLEPWIGRALSALSEEGPDVVVEVGGIDGGATVDPHVWLDPVLAQDMVLRVRDGLIKADSNESAHYTAGADALVAKLADLDEQFAKTLGNCRLESVATSHAAYGHLASRYGFNQVAIAGLHAENDVSPAHLAKVISRIRASRAGHILVEFGTNRRLAETTAQETGAALLVAHPMGSVVEAELSGVGDYMALMLNNLASLRVALECSTGGAGE